MKNINIFKKLKKYLNVTDSELIELQKFCMKFIENNNMPTPRRKKEVIIAITPQRKREKIAIGYKCLA